MEIKTVLQRSNGVEYCICGTPLVKRLDSRKLAIVRQHNGQRETIITEYSGDESIITCPKCGKKKIFRTGKKELGLTYVVAPPQN
jgi:hypothetical protein